MPGPFFTSNDSDIPQLEGLYVKERTPPAIIAGANLNKACMVAETLRGPVGRAIDISSASRFEEVFGGRDLGSGGPIANKGWKALMNKPFAALSVVRVAAAAAVAASLTLFGSTFGTGTIQCIAKASYIDGEKCTITDGAGNTRDFVFRPTGSAVSAGQVKVDITNATSAQDVANILINAINANNVAGLSTTCLVSATAGAAGLINITTTTPGTAGNQAITENVANVGFVVAGITGGAINQALMTVTANGVGAYGNLITAQVAAASDGSTAHSNITIGYLGKSYVYKNIDISTATANNILNVVGSDDGNPAILTKSAAGVCNVLSSTPLAAGADGSVSDSDYTAAAITKAAAAPGCAIVFVGEYMSAAVKAAMFAASATVSDRVFVIAPDNETVAAATAITEAALYRGDRMIYTFNSPNTLDNATASVIVTHPSAWMASILSQTDIDIHPGDVDNQQFTQAITSLYNEGYVRNDYIALRAAGICALEHLSGYSFVSGVTTSLVPGKEQITRRRMADFLQISVANALQPFVKKKNTVSRRKAMVGMVMGFLAELQRNERVVATDDSVSGPGYLVDDDSLNSALGRAAGIERLLTRVRLISHMLEVVLETEIGTSVNIVQKQ
jgi:hypothetical protein